MSPALSFSCIYQKYFIYRINSSDWNSALLDSQLPCKVGSSLTVYFLSNKHNQERQSCVCVVLKIAGFKSQCKPRAFLCRKNLPPGCKAYNLQGGFVSTPPKWGVWIGHLFHVAILTPRWGGVLANSICRQYAFHTGGRVFLQSKSLGLHWYLNPEIFSTTHTQLCLSYLCLYDRK